MSDRTYYYNVTNGQINVSSRKRSDWQTIRARDIREAKARVRVQLERDREYRKRIRFASRTVLGAALVRAGLV